MIGAGAAVSLLALPGCLALDLTTDVSSTGTFTGSMVTEFDRVAVAEFGVMDAAQAEGSLAAPASAEGPVSVEWSETPEDYVQTVTFTAATAKQIEAATKGTETGATSTTTAGVGFPLRSEVVGDQLVVSLVEDPGSRAGATPDDVDLARMLFGDSEVSLEVTMPGRITATEGAIVKAPRLVEVSQPAADTFALTATLADLAVLESRSAGQPGLRITSDITATATPSAPPSQPPSSPTPTAAEEQSGVAGPALVGAAAIAAAAVAAAVIIVRRRSQ